ncbi:enhanced serine sensitivity protein SseB C-terminal domain-containing protein [Brevundimonas sp. Root1279]|uniref:enhanced serine sensitivity protein SseB C-terminal domain-containing protein n=1 Tax=Brevundimonas sp. Root1279 TaxID=1736443 RepID=UPI0006F576B4|nr:enhanced serine sensitivity protein SseB C-terminal domain-containing protein [Brevundimonas sp. Root1279]KQW82531.1 hypothetical protein ASC65_09930 [Brevundimonas sp. Root1279]
MTDAAAYLFRPANPLEERLVAASRGDPAAQAAFAQTLPDETLYVGTLDKVPEGTLQASTPMRVLSIELKDGRRATAVFTAPERMLAAFGEGVGCLALPGRKLFEMIRADPAVLNPGQPYGVMWEPASLEALAGLPARRLVEPTAAPQPAPGGQQEPQVLLGAPAEVPTELMARLKALLDPLPQVRAAWLALAYWPGATNTVWHLDVRCDGDAEPIRRALGSSPLPTDRKLELILNAPGGEDGVGLPVVAVRAAGKGKKGLMGRLFGG